MGTLCNVLQVVRVPDGTTKVLVEGIARMRVREYRLDKDILTAHVVPMPWIQAESANLEPWRRRVLGSFERYNTLQPRIPSEVMASIAELNDLGQLINLIGSHISVKLEERQALLELQDVEEALSFLLRLLTEEIDILELEHDIQDRLLGLVLVV